MPQQPHETVALILRGVIFKHTEYQSLQEYLSAKYGFKKVKEKKQAVSEIKQMIPANHEKIVFEEEAKSPIVLEENEKKMSLLEIYEGTYLEARISVFIMGDVIQREDIVEGASGEQYSIFTAEYQMMKFVSRSGYSLQRLIEQMVIDLGLEIKSKEWVFHREGVNKLTTQ